MHLFQDLQREGLNVTDAFVVLNREQGGKDILERKNIRMHAIVTVTEVLDILLKASKIQQNVHSEVVNYIKENNIEVIRMLEKRQQGMYIL